jgi:hypothetical protein
MKHDCPEEILGRLDIQQELSILLPKNLRLFQTFRTSGPLDNLLTLTD